jgi:hypothetical protein
MHKKKRKHTDYSPRECSLHQHVACSLEHIRQMYVPKLECNGQAQEALHVAQAIESFNQVVSHGFKSKVACVLVGEVGLNFYVILDDAS